MDFSSDQNSYLQTLFVLENTTRIPSKTVILQLEEDNLLGEFISAHSLGNITQCVFH